MHDELNQLIRMAQVLRVRASNLSRVVAAKAPKSPEQAKKIDAAAELSRDVQTKLEQVRAYFD